MRNIGIMQGRLTEPKDRGIQFFPFENWKNEFKVAKELGLQEIEWIFDYENYMSNPLWSEEGCEQILEAIKETNIQVRSICWDYFMRRPFFKEKEGEREKRYKENVDIFKRVMMNASKLGAHLIEIPLVDDSSIAGEEERTLVIQYIQVLAGECEKKNMAIGLETDLPAPDFRKLLLEINCCNVWANYDSGNSSGLGYNHEEELQSLNSSVYNVHIKDRKKGGTTMPLGSGSADFDSVFLNLKKIGYQGSFILQAARGEDGTEKSNIEKQVQFVKQYLKKYEIE